MLLILRCAGAGDWTAHVTGKKLMFPKLTERDSFKIYRNNSKININIPNVSRAIPDATAIFFLFFSASVRGLILPFSLYLFSIDCPTANPNATPNAGPIPIKPGLSVAMLRGMPSPEKITMPIPIHIPKKWPSGYLSSLLSIILKKFGRYLKVAERKLGNCTNLLVKDLR